MQYNQDQSQIDSTNTIIKELKACAATVFVLTKMEILLKEIGDWKNSYGTRRMTSSSSLQEPRTDIHNLTLKNAESQIACVGVGFNVLTCFSCGHWTGHENVD